MIGIGIRQILVVIAAQVRRAMQGANQGRKMLRQGRSGPPLVRLLLSVGTSLLMPVV